MYRQHDCLKRLLFVTDNAAWRPRHQHTWSHMQVTVGQYSLSKQTAQAYQLVSCGCGNDVHVRITVLGDSSDRGSRFVRVGGLDGLGCLLCCLHGLVSKVDHILAGIREELLAKALKVAINQSHGSCTRVDGW